MAGDAKATLAADTTPIGSSGTAIFGGYIESEEKSSDLRGTNRYRTYAELLANISIVGSGVRNFLNLVAKAKWAFKPGPGDKDGMYAELAERVLTSDPATSFSRIVRSMAMYRFYGFSIMEWTAKRHEQDGSITLGRVDVRPQKTIERWETGEHGELNGVYQLVPNTGKEVFLPRHRLVYCVDDTLTDSPEGMGLLRHVVRSSRQLERLEQLEGIGFDGDLRGVPLARGPFAALRKKVRDKEMTEGDRFMLEKPLRDFMRNHIRNVRTGMLLDSSVYTSADDAQQPSGTPVWDLEILKGSSTSLEELDVAITRKCRDIARVLGAEQLMLGDGRTGSFALSKDKTANLYLAVDGTLMELADVAASDLLLPMWLVNGWPIEAMPIISNEALRVQDIGELAAALRDMASAGAVLSPDDPVVQEMMALMGLPVKDARDSVDNVPPQDGGAEDVGEY